MVYGETREAVEHARASFLRKWRLRCKAVVASFEEAGDELFTFLQFPQSQWKALRPTNALEERPQKAYGGELQGEPTTVGSAALLYYRDVTSSRTAAILLTSPKCATCHDRTVILAD